MALTDLLGLGSGDSSGGGSSTGGDILSMILPLVLTGATQGISSLLGKDINKNIDQANKAQSQIVSGTVPGGAAQVKAAQAGQLTPAQQAEVDQMKKQQTAQMEQAYSNMGIPMSTMRAQSQNEIEQKALAFANDLINQSFSQGIQAMQLGNSAAQAQLNSAMAQKKDLTSTISNVAQEIGRVLGTNKPTPTPATPAVPIALQSDTGFGADPYANLMTVDQT